MTGDRDVRSSRGHDVREPRVLLLATTTGYQVRMFGEAAERLGVRLVFATDRCDQLEDPWWDGAIPVRFQHLPSAIDAIRHAMTIEPFDGVLAVGDRPTVLAAHAACMAGRDWHPPDAAAAAHDKRLSRTRLADAGLLVPRFVSMSIHDDPARLASSVSFPCVIKPTVLSGSRGVMRANDPRELLTAFERLRRILLLPDVRVQQDEKTSVIQVEDYIDGTEYAVEGILEHGVLRIFAIFDKPDPLEGPFFEETIYVTPSRATEALQAAVVKEVARAVAALGLRHGPIHAECRVNARGVFVLEVAARPIGGLCARALTFVHSDGRRAGLEELLLRHAIGEPLDEWRRCPEASGVMMVPIPRRGIYRGVEGVNAARETPGIDDVVITAKVDQRLVPLPEGASYLGFIFAQGATSAEVERALRSSHARLTFSIDPALPLVDAGGV